MTDRTTIIRVAKRDNPYVVLDKEFLSNDDLSWKAKGLLAYLLSKPDNWQITETDLVRRSQDGRDAVRAGLRELEINGYLVRHQVRAPGGKFARTEYVVYERPEFGLNNDPAPKNNKSADSGKSTPPALEICTSETRKANDGAEITVDGFSVHGEAPGGKSDSHFAEKLEDQASKTCKPLGGAGLNRGRENRRRKTRHLLINEITNVVVEHPESGNPLGDDLAPKRRIVLSAFPELPDPGALDDLLAARGPDEVRQAMSAAHAYAEHNHLDNLTGVLRDALEHRWTVASRPRTPASPRKKAAKRKTDAQGRDEKRQKELIGKLYG